MYELTKKKTSLGVKIIIFLVACAFISELFKMLFPTPTLDDALVTTANDINKHCPIIVDSSTRLDNVSALPGKQLLYHYTLLHGAETVRQDTQWYKSQVRESFVNNIRSRPEFEKIAKEGMTFAAIWYDSTGSYVCGLAFGPEVFK